MKVLDQMNKTRLPTKGYLPNANMICATIERRTTFLSEVSSIWKPNLFRAPEPLPILNLSDFVPKNGFPVVTGLIKTPLSQKLT